MAKVTVDYRLTSCTGKTKSTSPTKSLSMAVIRRKCLGDFITEDSLWEVKCSSHLSIEHFLHIVIYAWLWQCMYPDSDKKFKILNIKSSQVFVLNATMEELTIIIVTLLKGKYMDEKLPLNNDDFLQMFCI